tara:strand:+ start:1212 stop:2000 length:789 start_codon:yes stop_codon:yes gene_type:complete
MLSSNSKVTIITTFNDSGYKLYGKNMLRSFDRYLINTNFLAYYEGKNPNVKKTTRTLKYVDLLESCPDLVAFKKMWKDVPAANGIYKGVESFRYHAVRFSHKMFCIYHAATNSKSDYLIWCDADTEAKRKFEGKALAKMLPKGKYCAYLGREKYSECGFMIFDTRHEYHYEFMNRYINILKSGRFLKQKEWHDSFLFDVVRKELEKSISGDKIFHNLTPGIRKRNFNTALYPYIIHYKGSRKVSRSPNKKHSLYNMTNGGKK